MRVGGWAAVCLLVAACGGGGADAGATDSGDVGAPHPDVVVPDATTDARDATADAGDSLVPPVRSPVREIALEVDPAAWDELHAHIHGDLRVPAVVTIDGERFDGGSVKAHGGAARDWPKKSYRVYLRDEPDVSVDLFGDGREKQRRFVLNASWIDRSFLRQALAMHIDREAGGLAPRVAFAQLSVNGELLGLYQLIERIDKPYLGRQGLESDRAHLYKAEDHRANWADKPNPMDGYEVQEGDPGDVSDLAALLAACSRTPLTDAAFAAEVAPLLDLEGFIVWQRGHTFMGDRDTFDKNYYLYHDVSAAPGTDAARFRVISWDADAVFGLEWEGTDLPGDQRGWTGVDAFSGRLVQVPGWRARYLSEYRRALAEELDPERLRAWVDARAAEIADLARADLASWQPDADWPAEVERLEVMIDTRAAIMREVLGGLAP